MTRKISCRKHKEQLQRLCGAVSARSAYCAEALEGRVFLSATLFHTDVVHGLSLNRPTGLSPASSNSPGGLTPAQMRKAYGVDVTKFGNIVADGSGQTIAIVDAFDDPNIASDLAAFDTAFGLQAPPAFTKLNQGGGATPPASAAKFPAADAWAVEISLDVEWAHVMAPNASIVLVEANSTSSLDLYAAVDTARRLPGVTTVSMSFAGDESSGNSTYDLHFTTPIGHVGVTFLAASGDWGSKSKSNANLTTVEYPAASPNVVGVGGTHLNVDALGAYTSESAWSGSGGGTSLYAPQPAYQNGVVTQTATKRAVPDVSIDADPGSGVPVYDSYDFGSANPWATYGGTSLSSPMWAGIVALVDQGRVINGLQPLDGPSQTLPKLYSLPATDFHDITSGSNGFAAGPGYDLVTGRGSPIVSLLASDLTANPAGPIIGSLTVTPAAVAMDRPIVLTAGNVVDSAGTVTSVKFYRESNNTWDLQQGSDTLLGTGTQNGSTWTLGGVSTGGLAAGTYSFYALATDSNGHNSSAPLASLNLLNSAARGVETRANTYTASAQRNPSVAMDAAGDYVVTWASYKQDGNGTGIFAQRYNNTGVTLGGEFQVNTYTTSAQITPTVAMDAAGDFVIAWASNGQDGDSYGIYAKRYNAAGVVQGTEFHASTFSTGQQFRPAAAMDVNGNFVITWSSQNQDGSGYGVFAQRFQTNGASAGAEFRVNSSTANNQFSSTVAMDSNGDFVVAWQSYGQDTSGYGIYAQRYNSAGVKQGSEIAANVVTTGNQVNASVAIDAAGDFAISWSSAGEDGSGYGIYARRYSSAGVALSNDIQVNTTTADQQRFSKIAMDSAGDFAVTWESTNQDGSFDGIFAQRFRSNGALQSGEFQVNTYFAQQQTLPAIAMDASGDFVVAWSSFGQDGDDLGIYSQRYAGYKTPLTTGLGPVVVNKNSAPVTLTLTSAFSDAIDSPEALSYGLISNSNAGLVTATVDSVAGTLNITFAANQLGNAQLDVRATDTGGLSVDTIVNITVFPQWLATNSIATWDAASKTLTVNGASAIIADPGSDQPNIVAITPAAQLTVQPGGNGVPPLPVHLGNLNLQNGGAVVLASSPALMGTVLVVNGVVTINGGKIDLTDGAMIVTPPSGDPTSTLEAAVKLGRNGGLWNGAAGISSSTAQSDRAAHHTEISSVGIALNSSLLSRYSKFDDQPVGPDSVLLRYTIVGDVDLNGTVNDDDVTVLGLYYDGGAANTHHWSSGDLDFNGTVDDDDATLMGLYYNSSATAPAAAAPAFSAAAGANVDAGSSSVFAAQAVSVSNSDGWLNSVRTLHSRKRPFRV